MNSSDSRFPEAPLEPERMLSARLRATTPAFEARFDDLQRRIAGAPAPPPWWRSWFTCRPTRLAAWSTLAAGMAAVLVFVATRPPSALPREDAPSYAELVGLDETLNLALPITDFEVLEALFLIPINEGGRS
jgi:hypothetical protein